MRVLRMEWRLAEWRGAGHDRLLAGLALPSRSSRQLNSGPPGSAVTAGAPIQWLGVERRTIVIKPICLLSSST